MEETIETIMQWHKETFPDTTLEEQMNKFELEAKEYDQAATREEKIKEFIDMNIVCYGIKRIQETAAKPFEDRLLSIRADLRMTLGEHRRALENKMAINRARKWHKVNGEYRHVDEREPIVFWVRNDVSSLTEVFNTAKADTYSKRVAFINENYTSREETHQYKIAGDKGTKGIFYHVSYDIDNDCWKCHEKFGWLGAASYYKKVHISYWKGYHEFSFRYDQIDDFIGIFKNFGMQKDGGNK